MANRMPEINLLQEARDDFANLDQSQREPINKALEKLKTSPEKRGESLSGNLSGWRKLVVGKRSIRIIFQYDPQTDIVWISTIGARRDGEVYRIAASRIDNPGES